MDAMNKTLVFDMDGTIANLYGVEGWLDMLRAEDTTPYVIAEPMYRMDILTTILKYLKIMGWKVVITTWLAKDATDAYNDKVTEVKKQWLDKYNFPYDDFNAVVYGTPKTEVTEKIGGYQILVDDNEEIRDAWYLGKTINAKENIMKELVALL